MLLVAEIGLNHQGNFDLAYELIGQASRAGADIAKFQFGWRSSPDEINYIDADLAHRLKEWCQWWDIEFMASIISEEALEIAAPLEPSRYKIASRTVVDNPQLVEWVLGEGKETFISLGFWDDEGFPFGEPCDQVRYIFCRSNYPTYPEQLCGMPRWFGPEGYYGFSDHMHGIEGSLLALSRGAQFIEKHFTLDKTINEIHGDHILSATPEELSQLDELGRPLCRLAETVDGRRHGLGGVP